MPTAKRTRPPAAKRGRGAKRATSYALSDATHEAIERIRAATGVSKAGAIELAVLLIGRLDADALANAAAGAPRREGVKHAK